MIKAVFFDIDGTLLTSKSKVLPSTLRAIEKLHQQGIICGIASGRGPATLDDLIHHLPIDCYVLYNGQLVFSHDKGIYERIFTREVLEKLIALGDEEERQIVFGSRKKYYGSLSMRLGQRKLIKKIYQKLPKSITTKELHRLLKEKLVIPQKADYFKNMSLLSKPIYQCVLLSPESEADQLAARLPECTITRSNPYSVDIIPKGGSKLIGIQKAIDYYGIDMSEVAVFGDNWNDCEMLQGAGIGIVMGNAPKEVQAFGDFVTLANDYNGIDYALKELQIIR
ncbi:hypothetical protein CBF34_01830 [Vagococcus penaei]|uniref:Uncharacterized protein n=1 Tax=Vagococcus penaei TaxID=633807 RepID=A0A1Q2D7J7_9ENTE|nr:Cof-type HAD-IIB family hydrolase [Vagococcus penaei]AQP54374.1 hypothetical protein BW732_09140 [Vagococcus penaei]RSU06289.1 hypothetical protein CBF34_01830 [Vagococcus penaei]